MELLPQGRRGALPRLELADIQSCRLRRLSDWCFSERHDAAVLPQVRASCCDPSLLSAESAASLQVLQSAWDESCCVDVFTGRLNNIGYVFCHNPTGPHRHSKEFWDAGLHTDVRFRSVCGGVYPFEHVRLEICFRPSVTGITWSMWQLLFLIG